MTRLEPIFLRRSTPPWCEKEHSFHCPKPRGIASPRLTYRPGLATAHGSRQFQSLVGCCSHCRPTRSRSSNYSRAAGTTKTASTVTVRPPRRMQRVCGCPARRECSQYARTHGIPTALAAYASPSRCETTSQMLRCEIRRCQKNTAWMQEKIKKKKKKKN